MVTPQTYGFWTVTGEVLPGRWPTLPIRCRCGFATTAKVYRLEKGLTTQCKTCANRARCQKYEKGERKTNLFVLWLCMRNRCSNPKHDKYAYYGGRGVTVHPAWQTSFLVFKKDILESIGPKPGKGWSLDRINTDGNYSPGNVRWATSKEQAQNKRNNVLVTMYGETRKTLDWCEKLQSPVTPEVIQQRLRRGWPPEVAFVTPLVPNLAAPRAITRSTLAAAKVARGLPHSTPSSGCK